jgi:hypothetical protein
MELIVKIEDSLKKIARLLKNKGYTVSVTKETKVVAHKKTIKSVILFDEEYETWIIGLRKKGEKKAFFSSGELDEAIEIVNEIL